MTDPTMPANAPAGSDSSDREWLANLIHDDQREQCDLDPEGFYDCEQLADRILRAGFTRAHHDGERVAALEHDCEQYVRDKLQLIGERAKAETERDEARRQWTQAAAREAILKSQRDTVECYVCGGCGAEQVGPITDDYDGDAQTNACLACHGVGRLDLDAVRKLVDDEAVDHAVTKDALLRKIEECDAMRVQRRSGWVRSSDRLPDDPREVMVWADDSFEADDGSGTCVDGWTTLAWYAAGRWIDGGTGTTWAHAQRITMWHEIADRPNEAQQVSARSPLPAAPPSAGETKHADA